MFLELAEQLTNDTDYDETSRVRTAIGRAYYAAFLTVRRRLEGLGFSFPNDYRVHGAVIGSAKQRHSGIGNRLETLFTTRSDADYKMNARMDHPLASHCLRVSRAVFQMLDQLR
jgi:uncharacterized protein (UPF0332 family)